MSRPNLPVRFGVWAPVYGAWGSHQHPDDPPDAGYRRSRDLLRAAEAVGFTSVLLAEHIINPGRPEFDVLETWTASAAIAEATERMEIIAAVKPLLFHPGVLAKLAIGIDHISAGRFAINLISAWFRPEMAKLGIDMLDHDARYRYSAEWLTLVKALWRGGPVSHQGRYFHTDELELLPRAVRPGGPTVYFGGESEPARDLAASAADVFFINGRSFEQTVELIADLRARPRPADPLRFGLSAFVVARESDDAAHAAYAELQRLADLDDRSSVMRGNDPETAMMKVNLGVPRVGTNGGTLAGLVGSYDQVSDRIHAFAAAGIELFMLQFQPLEREVERFGHEIIPRVAARAAHASNPANSLRRERVIA